MLLFFFGQIVRVSSPLLHACVFWGNLASQCFHVCILSLHRYFVTIMCENAVSSWRAIVTSCQVVADTGRYSLMGLLELKVDVKIFLYFESIDYVMQMKNYEHLNF